MKLKEVFIYNETYQLPIKEHGIFDSRVIKCSKNPMCLNNVKYDAETFISSFAKKVGTKIENGEDIDPIELNQNNMIVDGAKRYFAYKRLKHSFVQVKGSSVFIEEFIGEGFKIIK